MPMQFELQFHVTNQFHNNLRDLKAEIELITIDSDHMATVLVETIGFQLYIILQSQGLKRGAQ